MTGITLVSDGTPTPAVGTLNAPTSFTIVSVASTSMSVSWTAPTQDSAIGYKIYNNADDSLLLTISSWGATSAIVPGLTESTAYTLYMVSYDVTAASAHSNTDTDTTSAAPTFQLAAGHFVSTTVTGMTPTITFPRPNTETASTAYCRNAYTGMEWEIPIVVQGGSWPFKYELTDNTYVSGTGVEGTDYPTGMSIGEYLATSGDKLIVDAEYGVLSWPSPTGSSETIYILVTDQDGNTDNVELTIAIGTDNFVFIDAAATDDTGTGAIGDPKKTISGISTGFAGKTAVFRAGTYLSDGLSIGLASTPIAFISYPTESVTFDMTDGQFGMGASDFFIGDITLDGTVTTAPNWKVIVMNTIATNDRFTAYKCTFTNMKPFGSATTGGTDNPACIFSSGVSGDTREYTSIIRCAVGTGTTINLYDGFDNKWVVLEHNTALNMTIDDSNGGTFIQVKDNQNNVSVRANIATGVICNGYSIYRFPNQINGAETIANQEACYNVAVGVMGSGVIAAIQTNSTTDSPVTNTHAYRNSITVTVGDGFRCSGPIVGNDDWNLQHNAIYAASDIISLAGYSDANDAEANQTFVASDFDTDGNLTTTNGARASDLGIRGHEVA